MIWFGTFIFYSPAPPPNFVTYLIFLKIVQNSFVPKKNINNLIFSIKILKHFYF